MPGRQHQPVVGQPRCRRERHRARLRIDRGRSPNERDAVGRDLVVAELLLLDVAQPGDDLVAERAGREGPARLHQGHAMPGSAA